MEMIVTLYYHDELLTPFQPPLDSDFCPILKAKVGLLPIKSSPSQMLLDVSSSLLTDH